MREKHLAIWVCLEREEERGVRGVRVWRERERDRDKKRERERERETYTGSGARCVSSKAIKAVKQVNLVHLLALLLVMAQPGIYLESGIGEGSCQAFCNVLSTGRYFFL